MALQQHINPYFQTLENAPKIIQKELSSDRSLFVNSRSCHIHSSESSPKLWFPFRYLVVFKSSSMDSPHGYILSRIEARTFQPPYMQVPMATIPIISLDDQ